MAGTTAAVARAVAYLTGGGHDVPFAAFGRDHAMCLDGIAQRLPAASPLRRTASTAARDAARRLLVALEETLPTDGAADDVREAVYALFALRRAGVVAAGLEERLRPTLAQPQPPPLLPFDVAVEPPPDGVYPLPRGHPLAHAVSTRHAASGVGHGVRLSCRVGAKGAPDRGATPHTSARSSTPAKTI